MGKPDPPSYNYTNTTEKMDDILRAYTANLPSMVQATTAQIMPYEQALLEANKAIQPQYAQAQAELLENLGPRLTTAGNNIAELNAEQQLANEQRLISGQGAQTAAALKASDEAINPEFYKTIREGSSRLSDLLGSYDISKGLTGTEEANVERGLNRINAQRGVDKAPSATSAVQNAFAFDDKLQQKKSGLAQALQLVPSIASTSRAVDTMKLATGRDVAPSQGMNAFMGYNQPNIGAGSQQLSGSLLGTANNAAGLANQWNSNVLGARMGAWNTQFTNSIGANFDRSFGSQLGQSAGSPMSSCCFIFMEAYNGRLPWFVRHCRDLFYTQEMRKGYVWTANILVPLMQHSSIVRELVNHFMIAPLTAYGGWLMHEQGFEHGRQYYKIKNFWFKTWTFIGKHLT